MVRKPQDVTDAELAILQALWDDGPSTTRELAESLYAGSTPSQIATVLKLLERLEAKSCVDRDRSSLAHVFRATVDRDGLIQRRLAALAESLCDGSKTPLLMNLLDLKNLTKSQRSALRSLINGLDWDSKSKKK